MLKHNRAISPRLLFYMATIIFLFPAIALAQPISVTINGQPLEMEAPPIVQGGRTLIPLRAIFEALGATVRWDAKTQTITGSTGDRTVVLTIGSRQATLNGGNVTLDVPAAIIGGRTMVPVRFIADGLGARVTWDAHLRTVSIRTDGVIPAAPTTPAIAAIQADVTGITDGDTIRVDIGGQTETVRLIGVDTPESTHEVEPFAKEAAAFTRRRLDGKTVFFETDVSKRDRFGRLLAYVWLARPAGDNEAEVRAKMFNAELLLQGYAQIMTIAPNVKYADMFLKFEREARNAGKGLWAAAAVPGESVSGVVIASVDLAAEVVMLENRSRRRIDISGWVLVSEIGNQRFTFSQGTTIPAGGSIRVVSGPNATAGTGRLLWTRSHIWNNDGDPAVLLDGSGREISRR